MSSFNRSEIVIIFVMFWLSFNGSYPSVDENQTVTDRNGNQENGNEAHWAGGSPFAYDLTIKIIVGNFESTKGGIHQWGNFFMMSKGRLPLSIHCL